MNKDLILGVRFKAFNSKSDMHVLLFIPHPSALILHLRWRYSTQARSIVKADMFLTAPSSFVHRKRWLTKASRKQSQGRRSQILMTWAVRNLAA